LIAGDPFWALLLILLFLDPGGLALPKIKPNEWKPENIKAQEEEISSGSAT
jgi:hypothetical protein